MLILLEKLTPQCTFQYSISQISSTASHHLQLSVVVVCMNSQEMVGVIMAVFATMTRKGGEINEWIDFIINCYMATSTVL